MNKDVYSISDLRSLGDLDPPAKLAVFGDPVDHSLSPQLHNPALEASGIGGQYIRVHVPEAEFKEALDAAREAGLVGVNCTIPLKFAAIECCDHVDDLAVKLGAANTIVFEDGESFASNSDGPGFLRAIREVFSIDLSDLRVMVVGAGGGAGRAVAVQCALENPERLVLVNRTRERAETVRDEIAPYLADDKVHSSASRLSVADWTAEALEVELGEVDLIVNATSLGMKRADPELIPAHLLAPYHLVYDMVYSPPRTRLLADAAATGARTANGLSMLLHQGAISFETWFNRQAPLEAMRAGLESALPS